jgi:hypothetical protein
VRLRIGQGANVGQKIKQGENIDLSKELSASRLADEEDEERDRLPEGEMPEPPALEDLADSDSFFDDLPPGGAFDQGWYGTVPLISQLPRRVRPPVRFLIDSEMNLHRLGDEGSKASELEWAVADAVAAHIRNAGVALRTTGDWCGIPCIGGDRELLALVPEHLRSTLDEARLRSIGSIIKDFAIQLPSGDVIVPQTLLDPARKDKRTTRAAALSLASLRLELMPDGEQWTADDWNAFESTQRKKKYAATSRSQP